MFNDTDAHWWLAVDEKTGRMWLASRFGGVLLDSDSLAARAKAEGPARGRRRRGGSAAAQSVDPNGQAS
ncbi:MAG: hypothetical protein H6843_02230 [Rhodospirillaceae bacterium]|nr:hypothetical protein [Rhodospirillaceae bacterium]